MARFGFSVSLVWMMQGPKLAIMALPIGRRLIWRIGTTLLAKQRGLRTGSIRELKDGISMAGICTLGPGCVSGSLVADNTLHTPSAEVHPMQGWGDWGCVLGLTHTVKWTAGCCNRHQKGKNTRRELLTQLSQFTECLPWRGIPQDIKIHVREQDGTNPAKKAGKGRKPWCKALVEARGYASFTSKRAEVGRLDAGSPKPLEHGINSHSPSEPKLCDLPLGKKDQVAKRSLFPLVTQAFSQDISLGNMCLSLQGW